MQTAPHAITAPVTVARLLSKGRIRAVYQPVVRLDDRSVVGYEALMRGPEGSPLESARALMEAAEAEGLTEELGRAAVAAAIDGASEAGLGATHTVFLNIRAKTLTTRLRDDAVIERAGNRLRLVWEFVERTLLEDPAGLLAAVESYRERYWGVALDHVGTDNAAALALLPFVRPDVIKLDLGLIQRKSTRDIGRVVAAVAEHVELNGGEIVAMGVETEAHLERALTLGATLGQGWLFGRPDVLPTEVPRPTGTVPLIVAPTAQQPSTPFDLVAAGRSDVRIATKSTLLGLSKFIEGQSDLSDHRYILLSTFQHVRNFTIRTRARYARHAAACALTGIFGVGVPTRPGGATVGVPLSSDDPLAREWTVICIGPHYSAALISRDLGDRGDDSRRRFEFVLTHDRSAVVAAARSLMARIARQA
ncbi:EAL domain-containing protein [Euzebya sp.]|uniref:EAL domain-containing protein n=1 Tax=Euzebya sp. TaxID=1971409 RepID=UPI003515278D